MIRLIITTTVFVSVILVILGITLKPQDTKKEVDPKAQPYGFPIPIRSIDTFLFPPGFYLVKAKSIPDSKNPVHCDFLITEVIVGDSKLIGKHFDYVNPYPGMYFGSGLIRVLGNIDYISEGFWLISNKKNNSNLKVELNNIIITALGLVEFPKERYLDPAAKDQFPESYHLEAMERVKVIKTRYQAKMKFIKEVGFETMNPNQRVVAMRQWIIGDIARPQDYSLALSIILEAYYAYSGQITSFYVALPDAMPYDTLESLLRSGLQAQDHLTKKQFRELRRSLEIVWPYPREDQLKLAKFLINIIETSKDYETQESAALGLVNCYWVGDDYNKRVPRLRDKAPNPNVRVILSKLIKG